MGDITLEQHTPAHRRRAQAATKHRLDAQRVLRLERIAQLRVILRKDPDISITAAAAKVGIHPSTVSDYRTECAGAGKPLRFKSQYGPKRPGTPVPTTSPVEVMVRCGECRGQYASTLDVCPHSQCGAPRLSLEAARHR